MGKHILAIAKKLGVSGQEENYRTKPSSISLQSSLERVSSASPPEVEKGLTPGAMAREGGLGMEEFAESKCVCVLQAEATLR